MLAGLIEGVGASHDHIRLGPKCFTETTKQNMGEILDLVITMDMNTKLRDLVPLAMGVHSLGMELFFDCDLGKLGHHILHHSSVTSLVELGLHFVNEMHHLEHSVSDIVDAITEGNFHGLGSGIGQIIGVSLKLTGAELRPHN